MEINEVNQSPEVGPKAGPTAPPRNTGVQGPTPPTYSQFRNRVFFDCPTCKQENIFNVNTVVKACERCGEEIDRRPTLPQEQNGIKIDWISCSFKTCEILENLAELKPLEPADLKYIEREESTREFLRKDQSLSWDEKLEISRKLCPFYKSGLKATKGGTPFFDETWEWSRGARVARGSQGKAGDSQGDKSQNTLLKIPGKALDHFRKISGKSDLEIIQFLLGYGAKFTRIDLAIDHLPEDQAPGILNPMADAIKKGFFTSTWDEGKTPPKIFTALDFPERSPQAGPGKADSIIESITLGSRKSETYGRAYEKRREMIANGYQDPGCRWERFEIEIKKKRAEALGKKIGEWGENWKNEAKGLFRRFLNIRDEDHQRTRMKERRPAPWYDELLNQAVEQTLSTPRQVKKDREAHRACTVEQSGKRLFKIFLADIQEGGLPKMADTLEALVNQALKGMQPEDWEQLYEHLKIPRRTDDPREEVFKQTQLKETLLGFTEYLKTA